MAFTLTPWSLFGFRVMGDCGGETIYTDRYGRKIHYKKAPPEKPPSPLQRHHRDRFRDAVVFWKSLSHDEKRQLELAVHRACLCLTGQNLYTSCSLRHDDATYATIAAQTGVALPPLIFIP